MHGVFLDFQSLDKGDLDRRHLETSLENLTYHANTSPELVGRRIMHAEVVITNKVSLTRDVLTQAASLKLICVAATGTNVIDLSATRDLGTTVCNCQGYGTPSVTQHVMTLILALTTRLLDYHHSVQQGDWQRSNQFCLLDFPIRELQGKTLGIVGYGTLGKAVAHLARAFGMQILIAQRPGKSVPSNNNEPRIPLHELLSKVDILTLHCPLTEDTHHLIGAVELSQMKKSALLINTARGGIVDETALAQALRCGEIAGAGIDVLSEEPPHHGNVLLDPSIPNLILTPHSAWGSLEARQRIMDQLTENIRAFREGNPIRVVF